MHGVNWIMTYIMPLKFKKYGKISFMSGLLNSFTYVGSSISVYAIAIFSEHSGWSATLLMWSGIAFVGMAICLALSKKNTFLAIVSVFSFLINNSGLYKFSFCKSLLPLLLFFLHRLILHF